MPLTKLIMLSWTSTISDTMLTLRDRLQLSLSACRMVAHFQEENKFCWDFQPAAFGNEITTAYFCVC